VEAKFESPKQGAIQVIISPLVRLTNRPGASIESIGSADDIITSLGQFVTGKSLLREAVWMDTYLASQPTKHIFEVGTMTVSLEGPQPSSVKGTRLGWCLSTCKICDLGRESVHEQLHEYKLWIDWEAVLDISIRRETMVGI
jgi:hypothetical protein